MQYFHRNKNTGYKKEASFRQTYKWEAGYFVKEYAQSTICKRESVFEKSAVFVMTLKIRGCK